MSEEVNTEERNDEKKKELRGLYRYVKISVKELNYIIIALGIALCICLYIGLSNRGYTVTYDTNGGTDIESQKYMYGDTIVQEEIPTREGYTFMGWYTDENLTREWDFENDVVSNSLTLYAGWE